MDENRREVIRELADRTGLPEAELENLWPYVKEIIEKVSEYIAAFMDAIIEAWQKVVDWLADNTGLLVEELQKILDDYAIDDGPPRAIRQKNSRERARLIEQQYRAEIRRCERQRFYRRIYKPPR